MLVIGYGKVVPDHMMVITSSYQIGKAIEGNIQLAWIMNQVILKFGGLKRNNGGDIMICSDDNI